jgi:uncharacterized protein YjiS (DUF1127 family)
MAFVTSTRATPVSFADRFATLVSGVKDLMARRRVFNQTLYELNQLSDRDLSDLGLSRANVADVAREAAYKA